MACKGCGGGPSPAWWEPSRAFLLFIIMFVRRFCCTVCIQAPRVRKAMWCSFSKFSPLVLSVEGTQASWVEASAITAHVLTQCAHCPHVSLGKQEHAGGLAALCVYYWTMGAKGNSRGRGSQAVRDMALCI
eukprot:1153521-Pelagomonas_calceolata.AAC.1